MVDMVRLWKPVLLFFCAAVLSSTVRAGEAIATFKGLDDRVNCVAFAPGGKTLVAASGRFIGLLQTPRPGKAILWETASGRVLSTPGAHADGISSAAFSSDGRNLATSSYDGSIQLWNPSNGQTQGRIDGKIGSVQSVAFSSDGKRIAAGGWRGNQTEQLHEFAIWDVPSLQLVAKVPAHQEAINAVLFTADNTALVTGSMDGTVKIWRGPQFNKMNTLKAHENAVYCLALSSDGKTLAAGEGDVLAEASAKHPAGAVTLWDTSSWHERGRSSTPGPVFSLGFSPDGKLLAVAEADPTVQILNVPGLQQAATLHTGDEPTRSACFIPSGLGLAIGGSDGTVAIFDLPPNLVEKVNR